MTAAAIATTATVEAATSIRSFCRVALLLKLDLGCRARVIFLESRRSRAVATAGSLSLTKPKSSVEFAPPCVVAPPQIFGTIKRIRRSAIGYSACPA